MLIYLEEFFGRDRKARWRVIIVSSLAVALWGMVGEMSGKSVRDAQVEATVIGVLVFLGQVFIYCLRRAKNHASVGIKLISPRFPRRLALAAVTLVFLGLIPAPLLEAEILRRRLKALAKQTPLPDSEEIATLLNSRSSLNRPPPDLNKAEPLPGITPHSRMQTPATAGGEDNQDWVYSLFGGPGSLRGFSMLQFRVDQGMNPVRSTPKIQFVGLTASEAEGAIVGLIRPKNMPEIPRAPFFAQTFVVSTPSGSAIYLDYSHFKNLIFVDSRIEYDGGPTSLENVRFINCTFSLKQVPPTIRFAEAVMSHGSTNFTQPLPDQG